MINTEELIRNQEYSQALDILQDQIQVQPEDSDVLSKLGYCLSMIGKIEESEKFLMKASMLCSDDSLIWQQYGYVLFQLGKLTESIKAIENASKFDSENIWYFHQLAFLSSKAGDFQIAICYIDKAIELAIKYQDASYIDLAGFKASLYENINKDRALDIYLSLMENFENDPFSYDKAANIVLDKFSFSKKLHNINSENPEYNNATHLLRKGDISKAVKLYKQAINNDKYCYPAYLGIAQALYEKSFGITEISRAKEPKGIAELFQNYNQLNQIERNIINASVEPFANFIEKLNKKNSHFLVVPVDVKIVDYPANSHLRGKDYQDMSFCSLRGIGGDNGYVGIERLRDILWDVPDNMRFTPACAAHEFAHLVWCLLDEDIKASFGQLYVESQKADSFISNYSTYNVEEYFAEYYAYYARMQAANKPIPNNPVIKALQELQN